MKKTILLFSLFVFSCSFSNGQSWLWGREATPFISAIGDPFAGQSVSVDRRGNVFITGNKKGGLCFGLDTLSGTPLYNLYLVKYDANGNVLWATQPNHSIKGIGDSYAVAADKYGNVYLTGYFLDTVTFGSYTLKNNISGIQNVFLVKYDANGNVLWAKQTNPASNGFGVAYSVAVDNSGNAYIGGSFGDTLSLGAFKLITVVTDVFIAKYDTNGNVLWAKQGNVSNTTDINQGYSVAVDAYKNSYITGFFDNAISFGSYNLSTSNGLNGCSFLVKYDSIGNVLWAKQGIVANGAGGSSGASIAIDGRDNPYVAGAFLDTVSFGPYTLKTPTNQVNGYLVKYDGSGNVIWADQTTSLDGNYWCCSSMSCDSLQYGGGFLVIALSNFSGSPPFKLNFGKDTFNLSTINKSATILLYFDSSGNTQCGTIFSEGDEDDGDGVAVDPSGKYIYLTGDLELPTIFGPDTLIYGNDATFLARWQNCGEIDESIKPIQSSTPSVSVFPNPSKGQFTIELVGTQNFVSSKIEIYNILGEKVLIETLRSAQGDNLIDISKEPSGIYLYRVLNEDGSILGKGKVIIEK